MKLRLYLVYSLFIFLFVYPCTAVHPQDAGSSADFEEKIKIYREILKKETDPKLQAEAHFNIARSLEQLGRETEATAEYLKIILNYPQAGAYAKTAEERLSRLYSNFSGQAAKNTSTPEHVEETKDPAIFFTYIKSLYSTYIDQGKYDKALNLLNRLLKMDGDNPEYLEDIGYIYLNGYNDPDRALTYFIRIIEIEPNHPKAYTDIGLAYEKKGDLKNAEKNYRKGYDVSPFNSWSMYGISRLEALELAKEKKLIKDWYFLGPFENKDSRAFEFDFGPEKKADLSQDYGDGRLGRLAWTRPFKPVDSGYVDLNSLFKANDNVTAYAMTYVYTEQDAILEIRMGSDDPIAVWVNAHLTFKKDAVSKPAQFDTDNFTAKFKKGWNEVLIKSTETCGAWGFYFRITDNSGNTPLDLVFDPMKDTARAKKICSSLKRQKGFIIARTSFLFGTSFFVFLAGLYLLISNIYNKIEIRQMKDDFIAAVSHELKTPLAAIKMFAETLNMGRVKEEAKVKEYYSIIIRETDRLTRFINKILDFQKIEKGKKIYSFEAVDIRELMRQALQIYKNQIQDESLVVVEEYAPDIPALELDEDAMLQVFLNLLTNAYKYSRGEKFIQLKIYRKDTNIVVSVTDKGMGIPKDKLDKIFQKFYRVERDATRDIKGSGIGLSFVKSVVEAHGGSVGLESALNKGSTFMIFLPVSSTIQKGV